METMILHPTNKEQLNALKLIATAMKVDFETKENSYDPKFVRKILKGTEDIKQGRGVKIALEDLWK